MAASPDDDGEDSTELENAADEYDDSDGFDVEALLEAQFEAIDEDGQELTELIKIAHFTLGVDSETSNAIQQTIRAVIKELMGEHEEVTIAEVADALWSELLVINSNLREDPDDSEGVTDAERNGDEQAKLDDIAAMGVSGDGGDDAEVSESSASHDPAFQ
ncbi:hypothetical protein [Natronorubrum tibetense]|uniref:Uncharacterized protein n=1 Tax=Natronorubrum tibetense GA33 TaxID=1114856 RepID=L9VGW1_9EURY|nr:hypothetical protein [Natronorubrum tibetense]ELY35553.1 hypothetical protein C496_23291 [Natronorubrum tibetense GA33]